MPKVPIDYSNTSIYKICCKDSSITDIYVGHTTNLVKRRNKHKFSCNNENNQNYNVQLYKFIREHGGWDNWEVIEIENISLEKSEQAYQKEREWFDLLKPTLNSIRPIISLEEKKQRWCEYSKQYQQENKEKYLAYQKQYREQNKEMLNQKANEYYEANKDAICEKEKEYYESNKEIISEKYKVYYQKNREKILAKKKEQREKLKSNTTIQDASVLEGISTEQVQGM